MNMDKLFKKTTFLLILSIVILFTYIKNANALSNIVTDLSLYLG